MSEVDIRSNREFKRNALRPAGAGIPLKDSRLTLEKSTSGARIRRLELPAGTRKRLEELGEDGTELAVRKRALAILALGSGYRIREAAERSGLGQGTVSSLRQRYERFGLQAVWGRKTSRRSTPDFVLTGDDQQKLRDVADDDSYAHAVRSRANTLLWTAGTTTLEEANEKSGVTQETLLKTWKGYSEEGVDYVKYARTLASIIRLSSEDLERLEKAATSEHTPWDVRNRVRFLLEKSRGHSITTAAARSYISGHMAAVIMDFVADHGVMAILNASKEQTDKAFNRNSGPDKSFGVSLSERERTHLRGLVSSVEQVASESQRAEDSGDPISQDMVMRASALLAADEGMSDRRAAYVSGLDRQQVQRLRRAYCERGVEVALHGRKTGPPTASKLNLTSEEQSYLKQLSSSDGRSEEITSMQHNNIVHRRALALLESQRGGSDSQAANYSGLSKGQVQRLRNKCIKSGLRCALWSI